MLKTPFSTLVLLRARKMTIYASPNTAPAEPNIELAPSNYNRHPTQVSNIIGTGLQFIGEADAFKAALGRKPKRGDRLKDDDGELYTLKEVEEMSALRGEVLGYRIRVE